MLKEPNTQRKLTNTNFISGIRKIQSILIDYHRNLLLYLLLKIKKNEKITTLFFRQRIRNGYKLQKRKSL